MINRLRTADQTLNQSEPDRDRLNQLKPAANIFSIPWILKYKKIIKKHWSLKKYRHSVDFNAEKRLLKVY